MKVVLSCAKETEYGPHANGLLDEHRVTSRITQPDKKGTERECYVHWSNTSSNEINCKRLRDNINRRVQQRRRINWVKGSVINYELLP